jgi:hypothetical protein
MRFHRISFIAILVGMFSSCSDLGPETIDLSYRDQFPLRPGCYWKYAVHEIYNYGPSTVTDYIVTVHTIGIIHNPDMDRWGIVQTILGQPGSDTTFAEVIGDTVKIGWYQGGFTVTYVYVFPMFVGQSWPLYSSRVEVRSNMPIDTKAGRFENGFMLYSTWSNVLGQGEEDLWLVPGVGIVTRHVNFYFESPPYDITEELIEYRIPP